MTYKSDYVTYCFPNFYMFLNVLRRPKSRVSYCSLYSGVTTQALLKFPTYGRLISPP